MARTVNLQYIFDNNGSYTSNDPLVDDYVYYWVGDFKTGEEVKVPSLEVLRFKYTNLWERYMLATN